MGKDTSNLGIVVVTGPESTGKTELAKALANYYLCNYVPELAREFVLNLDRDYTYSDVEEIAKRQIEQFNQAVSSNKPVIFDTGLIITKVWFDVVYQKCPEWLVEAISKMPKVKYLLCDVDLPWVPDSVRENGGEMRDILMQKYKEELTNFGFSYKLVSGVGKERLNNALKQLEVD